MYFVFCPCLVSGSNLASHMVGSLKKGSKQSMSLPSTAYNTLPAHVHKMRSTTSSPRVISGQSSSNKKQYHKRSPSSDSGTGSNTPVSSYHSGKVHHTVYLHGKYHLCKNLLSFFSKFPIVLSKLSFHLCLKYRDCYLGKICFISVY